MSAAVYQESYKLPAGLLAVIVHGAFFALLYFGFAWQSQKPATMSVDLWKNLPDDVATVRAPVPPVVQPEPIVQPAPEIKPAPEAEPVQAEVKPDIVMPTKKTVPKPVSKPAKLKPAHPVEPKAAEVVPQPAEPSPSELAVARVQAEQTAQAAQATAVQGVIDKYKAEIENKIRNNIPDNLTGIPDNARVEFSVTVLPGGSVLPPRKIKMSGYPNYDEAVERAILKSQPLPLPSDAQLASRFRDLKLGFQPKETKER